MDFVGILIACLVVGGTGLVIGLLLGFAGKTFEVKVDERVAAVREALPSNNCGACGYAGCDACAEAIVAGKASVNACPVGGEACANAIAEIMGTTSEETQKMVAFVKCNGTCDKTKDRFEYYGSHDCYEAAMSTGGGAKQCSYGCLGLGSCVKACQFDALSIVNGIAKVDPEKCTSCGQCIKACPKGLIELVPYGKKYHIACNSHDMGKDVIASCENGCIGCTMCVRNCPVQAVTMDNFVAVIDYDKCVECGKCDEVCKRDIII